MKRRGFLKTGFGAAIAALLWPFGIKASEKQQHVKFYLNGELIGKVPIKPGQWEHIAMISEDGSLSLWVNSPKGVSVSQGNIEGVMIQDRKLTSKELRGIYGPEIIHPLF